MAGVISGTRVYVEPGYLIVEIDGQRTQLAISNVLRAADIPTGLTYAQVQAITTLANIIAVLIRTLIDHQVLSESFLEDGDYDLSDIIESLEDMGGDFVKPDISVT